MLRFSDFAHLPQIDGLVRELVNEPRGLILVAGLDSRPALEGPGDALPHFLPSGRTTIFRVLVSELLDAHPGRRCVVVGEDRGVLHVARRFKSRLEFVAVKPPLTYDEALRGLGGARPGVIVIDRLTAENLSAAFALAHTGAIVVSQMDTLYAGADLVRYLRDLGATPADLTALRWVLSVQRLPTLCPICRQPADVSAEQLAQLEALGRRYPDLAALHAPDDGGAFYAPGRCDACQATGRQSDAAVFDFFHLPPGTDPDTHHSRLPMSAYVWMLAQRGQLALSDALNFGGDQLRRAHALLMATTRTAADLGAALERKTAELDTANRLLKQRMRELVSLEGIGQALITWSDLSELGARVVRAAVELCKADRGVLYYGRSAEWAQVLAAHGWQGAEIGLGLARALIYEGLSEREPLPFLGPPPGIAVPADAPPLRAGLAVPLVAHGIPAGLMLIQSTRRAQFSPGEAALLQTLADYAAAAMQRAGLLEQLQSKIEALEAAQESIAQKERLERELELARQVQQSMLPRTFPSVPGLTFAAANAPARHVGGDFYDVIHLDAGRVGLVIADVSDKGMPAALYMALARSLILAESRQFASPAVVLARVNQLLLELGEQDMFVTVFYGVLDPAAGRLIYARAGHDRPFLIRDGAAATLGGRGMALGLFDNALFQVSEEELLLRAGDRLVLYTDGLSDVVNPAGQMFDQRRLIALVLRHAARPPDDFCRALFADLTAYQGSAPQFDDMALVVAALQ
ncbi:MAG: SpoIIE family protein phosphatase [Anaerolineae bacterium]|nr:SpoIIE family protein phosphatase [Anaerolineae bacterium]